MSKILICEDEAVIAIELQQILETLGHVVVGRAGSGREAVEMARRFHPDLILMDIVMPGEMDGIAAAKKIKAEMDIAVIFLTAHAADEIVERARQIEPCGYIVKPFWGDQIRAAVEVVIFKTRMEKQLQEQQRLNHYFVNITERKQVEAVLRRSRDELEAKVARRTADLKGLSARLLEVQEDERKKIAGELHDSVGQYLAAFKLGVENAIHKHRHASKAECVSSLESLIPAAQHAIEEFRRIHSDLRPPQLDDLGIRSAIDWFCQELEGLCLNVHIKQHVTLAEDDVPEKLKIVIFRILQEALNNAVKHSKADTIHVTLKRSGGKIELIVKDDGQGFDLQGLPLSGGSGKVGLRSMLERTEMSGGTLMINAECGRGTSVRALWPGDSRSPADK